MIGCSREKLNEDRKRIEIERNEWSIVAAVQDLYRIASCYSSHF